MPTGVSGAGGARGDTASRHDAISSRELRHARAKALREDGAAKQKAAMQKRLADKESRATLTCRPGTPDEEMARLQAALKQPDVSAATAHGIKKRLQVLKAAALREQRKEEGARREQVRASVL